MKKISILSLLIILCMCLSSCYAFGGAQKVTLPYSPSADDITPPEKPSADLPSPPTSLDFGITDSFDPSAALDKLYAYDYNFEFITVATTSNSSTLLPATKHFLDNCAYIRNDALEEKLHFAFSALNEKNAATVVKNLTNAQKNKTAYADVVAVSLSDISAFEGKDLLFSYSILPFAGSAAGQTVSSESFGFENEFFTINEASVLPSRTRVVFINSELMKKASIGKADPTTLISGGKWTWDMLDFYISTTYPLVTGDDVSALMNACVTEKSDDATAKVKALAASIASNTAKTSDPKAKFIAGEALVYIGTLADISEISEAKTPFSIMPVPVFNEGDDYLDIHNASDVTVYACPKSAPDVERSAFLLAALGKASEGSRADAFLQILEGKFLYDNSSRLALGYIFAAKMRAIY